MSESSTRCLSSASSPHLLSPRRKALSSKAIVLLNQGRLAEARILLEAAGARAHAEQLYASAFTGREQPRRRPRGRALLWRDNIRETELEPIEPGDELPGGLVALYEGRGRGETPLWLPEQRALVFADALTERDGELRVWATPWHQERVLPARCVRCSSSRSSM